MPGPRTKQQVEKDNTSILGKVKRAVGKAGEILQTAKYIMPSPGFINPIHLGRAISQNVEDLVEDVARQQVFNPLKKLVHIPIKPNVRDANDYSPIYRARLTKIVEDYADKNYPNWREDVKNGKTYSGGIKGSDYSTTPDSYGGVKDNHDSNATRIFEMRNQIENSLGSFNFELTPDGIRVIDTYDAKPIYPQGNSAYAIGRRALSRWGASEKNTPDNEKTHIDMTLPYSWYACGGRLKKRKYFTQI